MSSSLCILLVLFYFNSKGNIKVVYCKSITVYKFLNWKWFGLCENWKTWLRPSSCCGSKIIRKDDVVFQMKSTSN